MSFDTFDTFDTFDANFGINAKKSTLARKPWNSRQTRQTCHAAMKGGR